MRQLINRMNADVARRLAKADQVTARGKAPNRARERVLADGVEDNVDAAALSEIEHSSGEVLAARNPDVVAAGPFRLLSLGLAGGCADDGYAKRLRPTGNNFAHAAGGGVDQDRLACPHTRDVMEQKTGGNS